MSTLIASYAGVAGGSERLLLDVAAGLEDPPLIACPEGPLAEQARAAGLHVFPLRERSLEMRRERAAAVARLAGHSRELRRLIDNVRPDVVLGWAMRSALATSLALRGMREPPRFVIQHNDFLPGVAVGRALRAAAARADLVVCLSHAVARELDPDERLPVRVIHPGVDVQRFTPAARERRCEAVLLGAIEPWKRPDLALEAVAIAARELPDLRLRVAGAPLGNEGRKLLGWLRDRAGRPDLDGRVVFEGRIDDPVEMLRTTGCLLHCAEREPFGLVVAEAMACGTPVVVPDSAGPAEIADEETGALYTAGNARDAAKALVRVLRGGVDQARARERAERHFSLQTMHEHYREAIPSQRRPEAGRGMAIVTVSHNSAPELARLLQSAAHHLPQAKVVVVDSASGDDSAAVARAAGAHVIELGENRGFGFAANAGVAAAGEPVTILANPDVELIDSSLAELEPSADRLLAPKLLNSDGSRQDSAQPAPASAAAALYSVVPGGAQPAPLRRWTEPWQRRRPGRTGWAVAALLVAQTETLRRLGPFDDSIFLYGEDLDLGLRAAEAGVETWFCPQARALHSRGHSTLPAFGGEPVELLAEQRREVVRRRMGGARAALDDLVQATTFADRRLLKRLARRDADRERAQLDALRKARRKT